MGSKKAQPHHYDLKLFINVHDTFKFPFIYCQSQKPKRPTTQPFLCMVVCIPNIALIQPLENFKMLFYQC